MALRMRDAIAAWIGGSEFPRHAYPSPHEVLRIYKSLRNDAVRTGVRACPMPFPRDLQATLLHGIGVATGGQPAQKAAEDGRGDS